MKKNRMKYTIYDEYIICNKEIPKRNFSDYYISYIGELDWNKKWTCDNVKKYYSEVKEIKGYGATFKRTNKNYILTMPNGNKIKFKRKKEDDIVLDKIFITKDFEFFEKNYNEMSIMKDNNDDDINLDEINQKQKDNFNLSFEDNYDNEEDNKVNNEEESMTDLTLEAIEKDEMIFNEYEQYMLKRNFDITKMLKYFTKNKSIILILLLLKLSYSAISRLMDSSVVYIKLEQIRICKKIQKLLENGKK
jgi:hypothetical protein